MAGSSYDWVDEDVDAVCVTWVERCSVDAACAVLGATPLDGDSNSTTFEQVLDLQDGGAVVLQVATLGDWLVLVEPNGYACCSDAVLMALSRAGGGCRVVSAFWNVNMDARFVVAEHGAIIRAFDPVLQHDEIGSPLPEELAAPIADSASSMPWALRLAERLTGVSITREWMLTAPRLTVVIRAAA